MSDSSASHRIAKNTLLLYIRMFFMMAVSLYTSRVVLNTLGFEDFGLYNVVGGFIALFSFLNGAMASATQRYLNFELGRKEEGNLQAVFAMSVHIHAIISFLVLLLAETFGLWFFYNYLNIPDERFSAALWVYQFAICSTIASIMSVPYNAAIIAHEKMSAFAYISILEVILKLLIVYLLLIADMDKLKLYAILMFVVQSFITLIYLIYNVRHFHETRYRFVWQKDLFYEMSSFAGWNLFGNLAAVAFTQGINILLNIFFGPVVNAARGISVQVQNALRGFCQNFQTAVNPQITKSYASHDLSYMHHLIFISSKFSFYLLFFFVLPILLETHQILVWWLKDYPQHTLEFTRLILFITLIDALGNPLIQASLATGKIRIYQSVIGSVLLLIVPVSYVVLKLGGQPELVYVVHLIIVLICQCIRLWLVRPMVQLSFREYTRKVVLPLLKVFILALPLPVFVLLFFENESWRCFLVFVISFFSVGLSIYGVGLTNSERRFVQERIKVLTQRLKNNDRNSR